MVLAYALGSLVFGLVLGRLVFGEDIRRRDNPGASGSWRQYGPLVGACVALLDLGKGALAVAVARSMGLFGWNLVGVVVAVVAGHNWPIWFGFRGGGGLATLVGTLIVIAPGQVGPALAAGLAVAGLYRVSPLYRVINIAALPAGAVIGIPLFLVLAGVQGNTLAVQAALVSGALVGVRGLQLLRRT